ncbi:MAG: All-trans-nonaprenyl-diphosphate synthase (geranyl-diphosphate specific) [Phycisphaerae bacterium]|nr:All-trans-nonaprenyl-diphosphate synthase (geranyl-diphosphate specific) [Phycisphaerae bacterium]
MTTTTVQLADAYAPIAERLRQVEEAFDREIAGDLDFVNEMCDRVRSYRGKMLRPALLLLCGKACGALTPEHVVLGAVVEMVHMATLVHDDVLDEAGERRLRPTVNATEGNVAAVLLGDYLISHAFHLCSSLPSSRASRMIGAATNTVCEGELMQNRLRGRIDLSETAYFDIIRRKTAALTAVSCELGAVFAGAEDALVRAMRMFGDRAGTAFQIVDDVLDVVGETEKVGKTLGRDAELGKPTLPVIHALSTLEGAERSQLTKMLSCVEGADRKALRAMLEATGSLAYAIGVARRFVEEAQACLEGLPDGEARESLHVLAGFIVRRSF